MASVPICPNCGSALREIVWGYGTIADVEDAGDVVIGGCVIDVDDVGRVAAMQCPICGTRTDAEGVALEAPQPPATTEHPFDVSFSSPPRERWEVTMTDPGPSGHGGQETPDAESAPGAPDGGGLGFVDEDFGGSRPGGDGWRERVEPYASRDDPLPPPSAPAPERVEPYASREDAVPGAGQATPDRVEPYAARSGDLPPASAPSREHVDPYASRDDVVPQATGAWQERIEPYAGAPGEEPAPAAEAAAEPPAPGEAIDARSLFTSDFTDAEEEGWPPGSRDD
ncbi:hypothetical protein [Agrococcus sp. DT81.2]|uniref:hypothetical protein n=1 Tax=Agrococcus sp. DT81.2 TaxID=3393414 RepID=UPI003CE52F3F